MHHTSGMFHTHRRKRRTHRHGRGGVGSVIGILDKARVYEACELRGPMGVRQGGGVILWDVVQGRHGIHVEQGRFALGCNTTPDM